MVGNDHACLVRSRAQGIVEALHIQNVEQADAKGCGFSAPRLGLGQQILCITRYQIFTEVRPHSPVPQSNSPPKSAAPHQWPAGSIGWNDRF